MSNSNKVMTWFSFAVVAIALSISGSQMYYLFMPITYWFHYSSVEPVGDIVVGEKPKFLSTMEAFKDINLKYNDISFCKYNGEEKFTYKNEAPSSSYGKAPSGVEVNEWEYGHTIDFPGECYLKANIILQLPFGIERVQTVVSDKYKVRWRE